MHPCVIRKRIEDNIRMKNVEADGAGGEDNKQGGVDDGAVTVTVTAELDDYKEKEEKMAMKF